jgi:acyl-CoA reductase-like NAD-dependent aldehyde dehydrogenase
MSDDHLEQLIASNAKAIQALTEDLRTYQQEAQLDRARLYQTMADLARNQASYYEHLEAQDELIQTLSRRQGEIVEILKILVQK